MEEEKKQEIADKLLQIKTKAVKIRETLCALYYIEETHFSHDSYCSFICPICERVGDIDKDICTNRIAEILAVDCLKTLV